MYISTAARPVKFCCPGVTGIGGIRFMNTALDLKEIYERRFNPLVEYRNSVWKILCSSFFNKLVSSDATVLDLGCGYGEFINNISAKKKYAMDLNPNMPQRVAPDVDCLLQDCSATWPVPNGSLDVVFTSNFFEHLPNKEALNATLREARKALKPGGLLICLGPNIRYLPGAYWDFYDHYIPLSEVSLSEALEIAGFNVVKSEARFLPYTMATKQPPLALIHLYLKLPLLWRFFGKQFLVVARA